MSRWVPSIQVLVDLRTAAEVRADPVMGGRVIGVPVPVPPLDRVQIEKMRSDLLTFVPHAVRIGLICAKGIRSSLAYDILSQAGYNVVNLGGMNDPRTRAGLCRLGYWVIGCERFA